MSINDFKIETKEFLANKGLPETLKELTLRIQKNTLRYNQLILLKSEHRKLDDDIITGIIEYTKQNVLLANIRGRVMKLIDAIESSDLADYSDNSKGFVDIGTKDLPSKVLIVLKQMTPEIARNRLTESKDKILSQGKILKRASETLDNSNTKFIARVHAFTRSRNKDSRLLKKYVSSYTKSLKPYISTLKESSHIYDNLREDAGILCLYQIENTFSAGTLDHPTITSLEESLRTSIESLKKVSESVEKEIDMGKVVLNKQSNELRYLGAEQDTKNLVDAQVLFKDTIDQFIKELKTISETLSYVKDRV